MSKLLEYQRGPADVLEQAMRRSDLRGTADWSDMGTGKTYVACEVMRRLDEPTLVVGPKISRSGWLEAGKYIGVEFDYIHYDMLRTGRTEFAPLVKRGRFSEFKWSKDVKRIIFDEAHRCSGQGTLQDRLLSTAVAYGKRPLVITATVAESPTQLKAIGYALGLHEYSDFGAWARRHGCYKGFGQLEFTKDPVRGLQIMDDIRAQIFPERGIRIRKSEIANFNAGAQLLFPLLDVPDADRIDGLTATIRSALAEMKQRVLDRPVHEAHPMVRNLRARQEISLLKKPAIAELARDYLDSGHKVAFFENFKQSIAALKEFFPDAPVIDGDTPPEERVAIMAAWNSDRIRVLILNEQAGGLSISLHGGLIPPVSLVEVNYDIKTLRQVYGRTDRAKGKCLATIVVPVVAGSIEESIRDAGLRKGNNLDRLNDGDLFACVHGGIS